MKVFMQSMQMKLQKLIFKIFEGKFCKNVLSILPGKDPTCHIPWHIAQLSFVPGNHFPVEQHSSLKVFLGQKLSHLRTP